MPPIKKIKIQNKILGYVYNIYIYTDVLCIKKQVGKISKKITKDFFVF